ncbi:hypothetical protein ROBYS_08430 [Roseobacter sp. OBYS 0001]|nr:hypothetical protein ROBYS_08430 [Roseobacter sp. OBYS 0001]
MQELAAPKRRVYAQQSDSVLAPRHMLAYTAATETRRRGLGLMGETSPSVRRLAPNGVMPPPRNKPER